MISRTTSFSRRSGALLMIGTVLGGSAAPLLAQTVPADQPPARQPAPADQAPPATQPTAQPGPPALAPAPAPAQGTVRSITVRGNQRLEPETIRAYDVPVAPGRQDMTSRTSYVIAPDGRIVYSYSDMDWQHHVTNTLNAVREWRAAQRRHRG